jgi:hypothetical protein
MTSDIRAQIESANVQFVNAFKRGDAAALAGLYISGAELLPRTPCSPRRSGGSSGAGLPGRGWADRGVNGAAEQRPV